MTRVARGIHFGFHSGTQLRTPFLCSFQKQSIAEIVEAGTDLQLPPEPITMDSAFTPCCCRILFLNPGKIFLRPLREPSGKGQTPPRAWRSSWVMWGTAIFGLKQARIITSASRLFLYGPQPSIAKHSSEWRLKILDIASHKAWRRLRSAKRLVQSDSNVAILFPTTFI